MWIEIILTIFIVWMIWSNTKRPSNYPPGIWGYPVVGYIPFGLSNFNARLEKLHKEHGNIFCWRVGSRILVFLYDFKTIKEAFHSPAFAHRPEVKAMLQLIDSEERLGVLGTNGQHWQNIRRFMLRHLRDLGMGKSRIESAIQHEAWELVKVMKQQAGTPAPIPKALTPAVINVLWQMVADQRYDLDDEKVIEFTKLLRDLQESGAPMALVEIFPWLKKIVPSALLNWILRKYIHTKVSDYFKQRFQADIDSHLETLDEDNPRDFIDDYLIEMGRQKSDPESTMSNADLIGCLADLFTAGLETTTHTIIWAIFYLANFPEVQTRLHKEIDDVLPYDSFVSLEHKPRLQYTEAFIHEVLRYSSMVGFGVMHSVTRDTVLEGYIIPKNAVIFNAVANIHYDPKYFDSPKEFRPERFLNSDGKLEIPKEGFFPFGIGKRQCLGESLARMELLIFLTTLLQHLKFSVPPNKKIDIRPQDMPLFQMPRINQDVLISIRK